MGRSKKAVTKRIVRQSGDESATPYNLGTKQLFDKRHSRLYERVLLSFPFQAFAGLVSLWIISILPYIGNYLPVVSGKTFQNTVAGTSIVLVSADFVIRKFLRFPGTQAIAYILPTVLLSYGILLVVFVASRLDYSVVLLSTGFAWTVIWSFGLYFLSIRYRISRFALVPFGDTRKISELSGAEFTILSSPDLESRRFNGIIADLHSSKLTSEWAGFLAQCTLHRIPVYHTKQVIESLTGRVQIRHLSESEFGTLLPSENYEVFKRMIDIIGALVFLPLFLLVMVLVGTWIKFDSSGPVLFTQHRIGFRGRPFLMYKLRTMYVNHQGRGFTLGKSDPRITRAGRFLRRFRIDELPQLINVLLGQMSFIGPRPESTELTNSYEKNVPFFAYRHVVRPGLSGWAQVNQGYAAETDAMKIKLEYDFYYIKHFSFWLDTLITFKTLKTILTGFGAR